MVVTIQILISVQLDSSVDKSYRNKHYAHVWKKPNLSAPTAPVAVTQQPADVPILPTPELIASFAHLPISQLDPIVENTPPPPCPIATVPSEVLVEILRHVAMDDPSAFVGVATGLQTDGIPFRP
jgi:hypothetical protein